LKILKELNTDCQMTQVTILLINLTQQISEVPRELSWQAPVMKTKGECYWCVRPMILATELCLQRRQSSGHSWLKCCGGGKLFRKHHVENTQQQIGLEVWINR
jgi:hypothetical protein